MLVTVSVPNPLPVPASVERLKGFGATLRAKFDVDEPAEEVWVGNVLRFDFTGPRGNRFTGTVRAGENTVEVTVESSVFDGGGWLKNKAAAVIRSTARREIKAALIEALWS